MEIDICGILILLYNLSDRKHLSFIVNDINPSALVDLFVGVGEGHRVLVVV